MIPLFAFLLPSAYFEPKSANDLRKTSQALRTLVEIKTIENQKTQTTLDSLAGFNTLQTENLTVSVQQNSKRFVRQRMRLLLENAILENSWSSEQINLRVQKPEQLISATWLELHVEYGLVLKWVHTAPSPCTVVLFLISILPQILNKNKQFASSN